MYENENENPTQGHGKKEGRRSSGILKIRRTYLAEMDSEQVQERSEVVVNEKRISRRVSFAERCIVKEFPKDSPQVKVADDDTLDMTEDNTADISGLDQLLKGPIKSSSDENCQNASMNSTRLDMVDMDMTSCYGDTSIHQSVSSSPPSKHIKSSHFLSNLISGGDVGKKGSGSVLMFDVDDDFCEMTMTNVINPRNENQNTIFHPDHPASNMEETEVITANIKQGVSNHGNLVVQNHDNNMELTEVYTKNSEKGQRAGEEVSETIRFSQTAPEARMVTEETTRLEEPRGEITRRFSSGISANMELTCMDGLSLLATEGEKGSINQSTVTADKENVCMTNLSTTGRDADKENIAGRNLVTKNPVQCPIADKENQPINMHHGKDMSLTANTSVVKNQESCRRGSINNEQFAFDKDFSLSFSDSPEHDDKADLMKSSGVKRDNPNLSKNLKEGNCKTMLIADKENQPIAVGVTLPDKENQPIASVVTLPDKENQPIASVVTLKEKENQPIASGVTMKDKENQPITTGVTLKEKENQPITVTLTDKENDGQKLNKSTNGGESKPVVHKRNSHLVFDEDLSFDITVGGEDDVKEVAIYSNITGDGSNSVREKPMETVGDNENVQLSGNDKANLESLDPPPVSGKDSSSVVTTATKKDGGLLEFNEDFTLDMTNTDHLQDFNCRGTENGKNGFNKSGLKMKEGLGKTVALETRQEVNKCDAEVNRSQAQGNKSVVTTTSNEDLNKSVTMDTNNKELNRSIAMDTGNKELNKSVAMDTGKEAVNLSLDENKRSTESEETEVIKTPTRQIQTGSEPAVPARVGNPGLKRRLHSLELTQTEVKVRLKLHGKDLVRRIDVAPLDVTMETETEREAGGSVGDVMMEGEGDHRQGGEPENSMATDCLDDEPMPDNMLKTDVTITTTHDSNHSNSSSLSMFKCDDSDPWSYETFCDKMSINYPSSNRARCSLVVNEKINLESLKECLAANVIKTSEHDLTQEMISNVVQYTEREEEKIERMKKQINQAEPQLFKIIREAPERGKLHEDIVGVSRACRRLAKEQWKQFQINKTKRLNDVLKKKSKHLEMAVTEILDQTSEVTNLCKETEKALSEIDDEICRLQQQMEEDVVIVTKHNQRQDEINKLTEEKRKEHENLEKEKMKMEDELKKKEEMMSSMEKESQPSNRHDDPVTQLSRHQLKLQHLQALHSWVLVEETFTSSRAEFLYFNDSIRLEIDYNTTDGGSMDIQQVYVQSCLPDDSQEWFEMGNRIIVENLKSRDLSRKYQSQKSVPQLLDEVSGVVCEVEDLIKDIVILDLLHPVTIQQQTLRFNVLNPVTVKKVEATLMFSCDDISHPKTSVEAIVGNVNCKDLEEMINKLEGGHIIQKIAHLIKQFIST